LGPATIDADKGYPRLRRGVMTVVPRVAQVIGVHRNSAIDARNDAPPGYGISQRIRERVEEIFAENLVRMLRVAPAR
jgi:hypothetical protein